MKFAILTTFLFVASVAAFPVGEVKDLDTTVAVEAYQNAAEDQPADDLQTAATFNFGASNLDQLKGALGPSDASSSSSSSSEEELKHHTHVPEHFHGGHGGHEHIHYGGHPGHRHGGRVYGGNAVHGGNVVYGETISYWGKPYVAYSGGWWQ